MPKLKLSYFDFHGGRGEVARLAMHVGNIPFEDDRIPPAEWRSVRKQKPLRALPVLEVDGEAITQSNSISRYVGQMAGLYPADPIEALRCDEIMDGVEDILVHIVRTFFMEDEGEKKVARKALAEGPMTLYLEWLGDKLTARGGEYFADGRLTVADLKVAVWINSLLKGTLDYVPLDLVEKVAPGLVAHHKRIYALPEIADYYEKHQS